MDNSLQIVNTNREMQEWANKMVLSIVLRKFLQTS